MSIDIEALGTALRERVAGMAAVHGTQTHTGPLRAMDKGDRGGVILFCACGVSYGPAHPIHAAQFAEAHGSAVLGEHGPAWRATRLTKIDNATRRVSDG